MSKHAEPNPPFNRYYVKAELLTPAAAVNLASKLLQFATQEGTK